MVELANRPDTEVVDITPLTLDTRSDPEVVNELLEIILVVALTPLTVPVSTLPVILCVNEFIKLTAPDVTPFICVISELPAEVLSRLFIMLTGEAKV